MREGVLKICVPDPSAAVSIGIWRGLDHRFIQPKIGWPQTRHRGIANSPVHSGRFDFSLHFCGSAPRAGLSRS